MIQLRTYRTFNNNRYFVIAASYPLHFKMYDALNFCTHHIDHGLKLLFLNFSFYEQHM